MKLDRPYPLAELAGLISCEFTGPEGHTVTGINEIHMVEPGDLVFVDHPKYYDKALNSAATTILINKEVAAPAGKGLIFSDDPFRDYNWLTRHFTPFQPLAKNISESATIGEGTIIQPGAVVGNNVTIGKNCLIQSGAIIYHDCHIGDDAIIHAGVVLGADAFYFQKREGGFQKMHSCGRVIVGDRVEIGAACTIDRGVSGDTTIGDGTKMDNMIHIGHDTVIGKDCLIAAQVGISGCTKIGNDVTIWGQVGITANVVVEDGVTVGAQSGVNRNLEAGKLYFGSPAIEGRMKFREIAALKKLPEIIERLK